VKNSARYRHVPLDPSAPAADSRPLPETWSRRDPTNGSLLLKYEMPFKDWDIPSD
jgi:hypothetical protein